MALQQPSGRPAGGSVRDNMRVSFSLLAWQAIPFVVCVALGLLLGDMVGLVIGVLVGAIAAGIGTAVALVRAHRRDARAGLR